MRIRKYCGVTGSMRSLLGLMILGLITGCCMFNRPPVVNFTWNPNSPGAGVAVSFIDQSYDPDGNIVSWLWHFGDGSSSTQRNPIHTYQSVGTYSVQLTVRDDCGASSSATASIVISGTGDECGTPLQVRIWLDGTTFAIGSPVAIHFSFNKHVISTLAVRLPNGVLRIIFENRMFTAGQHQYDAVCGEPQGQRTLFLTATDACGRTATDSVTYYCGHPHIGP